MITIKYAGGLGNKMFAYGQHIFFLRNIKWKFLPNYQGIIAM
jgi:hypothetical protein